MAAQGGNYANAIERILELPKDSVKLPKAPDRIIDKETELDLGGVTLVINNYGATHTPASLVVAIPADKVVYAGDILYSGRLLAVLSDSNVKSWISVYDQLKQFGDVTSFPATVSPAR